MPYKRAQIVRTLELLVANESIRDVDPTTKRLVARCLSGDWCVQFRKTLDAPRRVDSPSLSVVSEPHSISSLTTPNMERSRSGSIRGKNYKASRSAENLLNVAPSQPRARGSSGRTGNLENLRQPSADSATSLPKVVSASMTAASSRRRDRTGSVDADPPTAAFSTLAVQDRRRAVLPDTVALVEDPLERNVKSVPPYAYVDGPRSPTEPPDSPISIVSSSSSTLGTKARRSAPAPPPRRRKPPAVPVGRPPGGATIAVLSAASSQPSLTSLLPKRT